MTRQKTRSILVIAIDLGCLGRSSHDSQQGIESRDCDKGALLPDLLGKAWLLETLHQAKSFIGSGAHGTAFQPQRFNPC